jgi:hypothetical protein
MAELVSPCCGAEYSDMVDSQGYEAHECSSCKDIFAEPIEDYEYDEAQKEAKAEAEADERRDMGL